MPVSIIEETKKKKEARRKRRRKKGRIKRPRRPFLDQIIEKPEVVSYKEVKTLAEDH